MMQEISKAKILIVEDEPIIATGIQRQLERLGYSVTNIVSSGKEAIDEVSGNQPDLILMDIKLDGEMDGITAADQIRKRYNIHVVYLSAYQDDSMLKRARVTEPYGYLLKPLNIKEVHTTIEMALYKKQIHEKEARLLLELEKANEQLVYKAMAEKLISEVSTGFINIETDEIDSEIGKSLELVCKFFDMDGSCLFIKSDNEKTIDRAYNWHGRNIKDCGNNLIFLKTGEIPWLMGRLNRFEVTYIHQHVSLTTEAEKEKEILQAGNSLFLIILPMKYKNSLFGFLRFDYIESPDTWREEYIEQLRVIGEIFTNALVRKSSEKALQETLSELRQTLNSVIQALTATLEIKDPYTAGHQQRVSDLAGAIAKEMGLSKDQIESIRVAGIMHDLGKIWIPSEILTKPVKLHKVEFDIIKQHVQSGYEILKKIDFPWPIADIVRQHHEKMDGSGYPLGLSGEEISIEGRVLCVADIVEAIASHRPYRPALGMDKALEEISKGRDKLYDSKVVDVCINLIKEKKFVFK